MHLSKNSELRQKVNNYGAKQLEDAELLYLILAGIGTRSAEIFVKKYFEQHKFLGELCYYYKQDLVKSTLNETKQAQLLALAEFTRRYQSYARLTFGQFCSSKILGDYLVKRFGLQKQEKLWGIYLDTKNQLIAVEELFVGTLNAATVHPREVLGTALKYAAARFIVAHNHPSGQLEPSPNDIALTKRLKVCGEILGIPLLDHIIIGKDAYLSFSEAKILIN